MCQVCDQVERDELTAPEALEAINTAVSAGSRPEHFKRALDTLLGTELVDRNPEAEAEFESRYRNDS